MRAVDVYNRCKSQSERGKERTAAAQPQQGESEKGDTHGAYESREDVLHSRSAPAAPDERVSILWYRVARQARRHISHAVGDRAGGKSHAPGVGVAAVARIDKGQARKQGEGGDGRDQRYLFGFHPHWRLYPRAGGKAQSNSNPVPSRIARVKRRVGGPYVCRSGIVRARAFPG